MVQCNDNTFKVGIWETILPMSGTLVRLQSTIDAFPSLTASFTASTPKVEYTVDTTIDWEKQPLAATIQSAQLIKEWGGGQERAL